MTTEFKLYFKFKLKIDAKKIEKALLKIIEKVIARLVLIEINEIIGILSL